MRFAIRMHSGWPVIVRYLLFVPGAHLVGTRTEAPDSAWILLSVKSSGPRISST